MENLKVLPSEGEELCVGSAGDCVGHAGGVCVRPQLILTARTALPPHRNIVITDTYRGPHVGLANHPHISCPHSQYCLVHYFVFK